MGMFALHDGSVVVNVVVAEDADIAAAVTGYFAIPTDGEPWIGWTLVEGEWVKPSPPPQEEVPQEEPLPQIESPGEPES